MMEQEFSSVLLENAVSQLSRLPGVGRKTALRLALHLLRQDEQTGVELGQYIGAAIMSDLFGCYTRYFSHLCG